MLNKESVAENAADRLENLTDQENIRTIIRNDITGFNIKFLAEEWKNNCSAKDLAIMFNLWEASSIQDRPLINPGHYFAEPIKLADGSTIPVENIYVDVENLLIYLQKHTQSNLPLYFILSGGYHSVVVKTQLSNNDIIVDFYDAYEVHNERTGSYLENKIREIFHQFFIDKNVKVTPHYTGHQELKYWGECGLYSNCYYLCLQQYRDDPSTFSKEKVREYVSKTVEVTRKACPDYYEAYDKIFEYMFTTGYTNLLIEEINKAQEKKY